jgi:hypothetical protein
LGIPISPPSHRKTIVQYSDYIAWHNCTPERSAISQLIVCSFNVLVVDGQSVSHQNRQFGMGQNVPRRAAEDHLPQPALCVGTLSHALLHQDSCERSENVWHEEA